MMCINWFGHCFVHNYSIKYVVNYHLSHTKSAVSISSTSCIELFSSCVLYKLSLVYLMFYFNLPIHFWLMKSLLEYIYSCISLNLFTTLKQIFKHIISYNHFFFAKSMLSSHYFPIETDLLFILQMNLKKWKLKHK